MNKKTIIIDIDGTICTEEKTFEKCLAKPFDKAREKINEWYENNIIIFWTARGWEQFKITEHWLKENGFKYHQLIMGKPIYDLFIDDRSKFPNWDEL